MLWCLPYGLRTAEAQPLQIADVALPNANGLGALMVRAKRNRLVPFQLVARLMKQYLHMLEIALRARYY